MPEMRFDLEDRTLSFNFCHCQFFEIANIAEANISFGQSLVSRDILRAEAFRAKPHLEALPTLL